MRLPIIVFDGNDITIYPSVEDLNSDLELQDVEDDSIRAYDQDGNLLDMIVTHEVVIKKILWFRWHTPRKKLDMKIHDPLVNELDTIKDRVRSYLIYNKELKSEVEGLTFEEMVDRVRKYQ